jgi:FecR protein
MFFKETVIQNAQIMLKLRVVSRVYVEKIMLQPSLRYPRLLQRLALPLALLLVFLAPQAAQAQVALSWARIEFLRNRVQLIPSGGNVRNAQLADVMSIGDALRTASSARAELRFNDGSLARIGERATFRFTPNTRNFQLSNGTVLLLIPPGNGRTTIQTPNAVTGIQGSALFVRSIPETNTTIVGALTNNPVGPMNVFNQDGSQAQPLYAGQMVVIQDNTITELYEFDLRTFYETSGLVEGLNLMSPLGDQPNPDGLDGVRQEILDALSLQTPLPEPSVAQLPSLSLPPVGAGIDPNPDAVPDFPIYDQSPALDFLQNLGREINQAAVGVSSSNARIYDDYVRQASSRPPALGDNNIENPPPSRTPANPGDFNWQPSSNGNNSTVPNTPPANTVNTPSTVNPSVITGPVTNTPVTNTPVTNNELIVNRTPVSPGQFDWQAGSLLPNNTTVTELPVGSGQPAATNNSTSNPTTTTPTQNTPTLSPPVTP